MHDFWNGEKPEENQQQLLHILKHSALLGAALALLSIGRRLGWGTVLASR